MNLSPEWRQRLTHRHLARLARSSRPILVGPWRSEIGFEALYWLPFLRAWARRYQIKPERLVIVSRGGASILYGTQSVDLYRLRSVDTVRMENQYDWQTTKLQKQTRVLPWDLDVLKEAAAHALGRGQRYHVLHPAWMYWALGPFWEERRGLQFLSSLTDYEPIGKVHPLQHLLPSQYVAMKWYDRATFPGHEDAVQRSIEQIVSFVGAQTPIVLLTGTPDTDEHVDIDVTHPSIVRLPVVTPDHNVEQQIQVLSHAAAFVGTYGGMAQLALRLGVPSVSLYHQFGGTCHAHLTLSEWISKRTGVPFLCGSLNDLDGWRKVLVAPTPAVGLVARPAARPKGNGHAEPDAPMPPAIPVRLGLPS